MCIGASLFGLIDCDLSTHVNKSQQKRLKCYAQVVTYSLMVNMLFSKD